MNDPKKENKNIRRVPSIPDNNSDKETLSTHDSQKFARELFGLFLIFWGLLMLLSLISHDQRDPSLNHVVSTFSTTHNHAGIFGAYLSGVFVDIFGFSAIIWPPIFIAWGAGCLTTWLTIPWWRWLGFFILACCLISFSAAWNFGIGDLRGGGILGMALYNQFTKIFGRSGSTLIWLFLFFVSLEFSFGIAWLNLIHKLHLIIKNIFKSYEFSIKNFSTIFSKLDFLQYPIRKHISIHKQKELVDIIPLYEIYNPSLVPAGHYSFSSMEIQHTFIPINTPIASLSTYSSEKLQKDTPTITSQYSTNDVKSIYSFPEHNEDPKTLLLAYPDEINDGLLGNIALQKNESANELFSNKEQVSQHTSSTLCTKNTLQPNVDSVCSLQTKSQPITANIQKGSLSPRLQPTAIKQSSQTTNAPKKKLSFPSLTLLRSFQENDTVPSTLTLKEKSKKVMDCLADFNIQCELVRITPGPVITLFEIRPAPGVRVSRIANLNDDLARSLMAEAIRIQAPVPGSDTVGIEIPNDTRSMVSFKALIRSESFQNTSSPLSMALGKDIEGKPTIKDLATMPHVLVAGTTGAGKSVCLNTILLSFLYNASPNELKLLLIDPKRVELAMYTDLPHLVHPVITEPVLAKTALEWAVYEMDRRYNCLARLGVKHFKDFNKKLHELGKHIPSELSDLTFMPYFVVVIDELADLMMTAGKDVEGSIVRLAQLARAAGIHLIVATQRPSVDVVTGLIKANFPSRIAFQVANKYDSRTILDTTGAEQLLGKGDMLFKPNGGKIQRLHGAFVSDEEVQAITEHWKKQQTPHYDIDFSEWNTQIESHQPNSFPTKTSFGSSDEETLYAEAISFVREQGRMSISLLQRKFRIGFNKAARFVERMEEEGILPPAGRTNKARIVRQQ